MRDDAPRPLRVDCAALFAQTPIRFGRTLVLSTTQLTMQFGAAPLFENVSVKFGAGHRYGLIGANGSGKSTFLKILGRDLDPTSGTVAWEADKRVGKLRQDQFAFESYTVLDTVIMGDAELWRLKSERERLYGLSSLSEDDGMRVAELEADFAARDGYTAESRAAGLLTGLGVPMAQHNGPMSAVAPGWKLRVLLAQALFPDPDILLLDEPTNHLDIHTIRWLEELLVARRSTMVIISHDRHFLNQVCTHIADLDYGEVRIFPGNYDEYMTAATEVRERRLADNARKKAQIAELQAFVSRFSANASKARQATSRARQIEKIQLDEIKPSSRVSPYIRFDMGKKLYRQAVEVRALAQGYDDLLWRELDLYVGAGARIGVIGANGAGKTTLLRTLAGELTPRAGEIQWAEGARVGYCAQDHGEAFAEDLPLLAWMSQWAQPTHDEQAIRAVLGRLLFSREESEKSVRVLSGGERARMIFGKLMLLAPNVLILDEPTNHLDMESIEALNLALVHYPGTLIFASHDREFVSSLATEILELDGGQVTVFGGGYEDYLKTRGAGMGPRSGVS